MPYVGKSSGGFCDFLLCYAQCLGYLLHIMFPFPGILQHYVEFVIHTITTLEKLFGVGSFGGYISYLACRQAIFLVFLGELGLPFVVQIVAPTFLGCWALITFTFVTCF